MENKEQAPATPDSPPQPPTPPADQEEARRKKGGSMKPRGGKGGRRWSY